MGFAIGGGAHCGFVVVVHPGHGLGRFEKAASLIGFFGAPEAMIPGGFGGLEGEWFVVNVCRIHVGQLDEGCEGGDCGDVIVVVCRVAESLAETRGCRWYPRSRCWERGR